MKTLNEMSEFTRAYIVAALWTYDEHAPSGQFETIGRVEELFPKISPETLEQMEREADAFQSTWGFLWRESGQFAAEQHDALLTDKQAGHDFWLTRNHYGSGFWDRGIGATGDGLTRAAHECGERNLYTGDDGRIYL